MRKFSDKQKEQQKLWQALGTVKGFPGYMLNLHHVITATNIYSFDKIKLLAAMAKLRIELDNCEASIRTELKDL